MKKSRIRGLTVEELDAVTGGVKNGWVTEVSQHPGKSAQHPDVTTSEPYGQAKQG